MSKIKIHRKREWSLIIGYRSIFEVLLDGQRIGYLLSGETNEFEVTPGVHKLRIKAGWFGSRECNFNIFGKETMSFTVSSIRNYSTIAAILFIIAIEFVHLVLKIHPQQKTVHIILGGIIAGVIGFQVFGRNASIFIRDNKED
jgi:hypothetical protein